MREMSFKVVCDASGTTAQITIKITRNMTVSAVFASAGELVRNGTFDNGTTSWSLGRGGGREFC